MSGCDTPCSDSENSSYTVLFSANGGSGSMANMVCKIGQTYDVPECDFTYPDGKTFAGWNLLQGKTQFSNLSETSGDIILLEAQWSDTGILKNGNILIDGAEDLYSSFAEVITSAVTVTGSDDNWSGSVRCLRGGRFNSQTYSCLVFGRDNKDTPYEAAKYFGLRLICNGK